MQILQQTLGSNANAANTLARLASQVAQLDEAHARRLGRNVERFADALRDVERSAGIDGKEGCPTAASHRYASTISFTRLIGINSAAPP